VTPLWIGIAIAAAAWLALIALTRWLLRARIRGGEFEAVALLRIIHVYTRLVHRVRFCGVEHIPAREPDPHADQRPLIVVCNHTAGVDPLLVQAGLPFEVRWIMAKDMRARVLEPLWSYARVIFVDRERREAASLRDALRHLKDGGALGVFPEGNLERPPRQLPPFRDGVGYLVRKSGALVLPAVIDGAPQVETAWKSLFRRGRARVRFLPVVDYTGAEASEIAPDLRRRFAEATGWPMSERTPILAGDRRIFVGLDGRYVEDGRVVPDEEAEAVRAAQEDGG